MRQSASADVPSDTGGQASARQAALAGMVVALAVFISCLIGIWTRPPGFVAALWPANAVMLGMLIRWPRLAGHAGWAGAFVGFMLADLSAGDTPLMALWLTLANLAGVFTGWTLLQRLDPDEQRLASPNAVLHLFGICAAASAAAALTGGGIATSEYAQDMLTGLTYWFTAELANYIILLPVVLTWPQLKRPLPDFLLRRSADAGALLTGMIPALALGTSLLAAMAMGGPGAIFFPVPALLWCALSYRLFTVSLLTLGSVVWAMEYTSRGTPDEMLSTFFHAATSIRMGITLLALAPLTVASVNAARNRLLAELDYAAFHDPLTGALTRGAFIKRGAKTYAAMSATPPSAAALMLELDRFRQIDDEYGYWAGDRLLEVFSRQVRLVLREQDLFGRLGDDEFSVLLFDVSREEALAVAERLRSTVERMEVPVDDDDSLTVTVTVGVAWIADVETSTLERLLARADAALYQARKSGWNQVACDEKMEAEAAD